MMIAKMIAKTTAKTDLCKGGLFFFLFMSHNLHYATVQIMKGFQEFQVEAANTRTTPLSPPCSKGGIENKEFLSQNIINVISDSSPEREVPEASCRSRIRAWRRHPSKRKKFSGTRPLLRAQ